MEELSLPVTFLEKDWEFPITMYPYGYTFRIDVLVGESAVTFEPDEEGSFRALLSGDQVGKNKLLSRDLLGAIAGQLEKLQ